MAFGNYGGLPIFKEHSLIRIFHTHSEIRIIPLYKLKVSFQHCREQDAPYSNASWPEMSTPNWVKMLTNVQSDYKELGTEYLHSNYFLKTAMLLWSPSLWCPHTMSWWGRAHQYGNIRSFSTKGQQMAGPFPITPSPALSIQRNEGEQNTGERNCHRGRKTNQNQQKAPKTQPQGRTLKGNLYFLQPGSKHLPAAGFIYSHLIQILNASKCYGTFFFFENKNDNNWNKTGNEKTQRLK